MAAKNRLITGHVLGVALAISSSVLSTANAETDSDARQLTAFVETVWRSPANFVDLHLKIRVLRLARSAAEIRWQISAGIVDAYNRSADIANEASLNARINALVSEAMKREGRVQYHFQRFRTDGESRRVDTVEQSEKQWGETQQFDESSIIGRITDAGSLTEITVSYPMKSCTADSTRKKPTLIDPKFQMLGSVETTLRTMIRGSTGRKVGENRIEQDAKKTTDFVAGAQTLVPSVTRDTLESRPVLRFDFAIPKLNAPLYTVYCDGENVGRPLLQIVRDGAGRTIRRTEQSRYEDDGFPRYWKETVINIDGSEEFEERIVTQLDLSTKPPEEVFQYHVPKGFLGAYVSEDKVVFTYPDGRIEEQVRTVQAVMPRVYSKSRSTFLMINFWVLATLATTIVATSAYRYWKRARNRRIQLNGQSQRLE